MQNETDCNVLVIVLTTDATTWWLRCQRKRDPLALAGPFRSELVHAPWRVHRFNMIPTWRAPRKHEPVNAAPPAPVARPSRAYGCRRR